MTSLDFYIVDAFTDKQFKGNPAAVVPLTEWLDERLMQSIATENNLSETAFIKQIDTNTYQIRWFSPLTEVDFCGHATLATSFVLYNQLGCKDEITYVTRNVGTLTVEQTESGRIQMVFPNLKPSEVESPPKALLDGLSITPKQVLRNRQAFFAVLNSESEVLSVQYDSNQLRQLAPYDVVVTAKGEQADFVSRYFWPANGGDEDPVTGSIHAGLAPYWAEQFKHIYLVGYQASKRGGTLYCKVNDDSVEISGCAVLYSQGKIFIQEQE